MKTTTLYICKGSVGLFCKDANTLPDILQIFIETSCGFNQKEQIPRNPVAVNNMECNCPTHPTQPAQLIPTTTTTTLTFTKTPQPAQLTRRTSTSLTTSITNTTNMHVWWLWCRSVCEGWMTCIDCVISVGCVGCGGCEGFGGVYCACCDTTNTYAWALKFPGRGECVQPEPQPLQVYGQVSLLFRNNNESYTEMVIEWNTFCKKKTSALSMVHCLPSYVLHEVTVRCHNVK